MFIILLYEPPDATMTVKSVYQQHASYIRSLEESELCKHWYINVAHNSEFSIYTAPPYARKLIVDTEQFDEPYKSMVYHGVFGTAKYSSRFGCER